MKKIALYYPWCYLKSGVERVILETVNRSRHQYTIFTNHIDYEQTFPEFKDQLNVVVLKNLPVQRTFLKVLQGVWTIYSQKLNLDNYDALLVHSEGLGDFITFKNHDKPVICFCHTPVRPIYDPVYRREWQEKNPSKRMLLDIFTFFYKRINRYAWLHYQRVFVNSSEVKSRILAGMLCNENRMEVLNPGVAVERINPTPPQGKRFLYAGRIKWTKNVELAIKAFQEFKKIYSDGKGWRLTITGGVDKASGDYYKKLLDLVNGDPSIEFILDPSRELLEQTYSESFALIYPPLNEDWGIVPIEAMAFGKPVLAVNSGGPKETVVDGVTGYLMDPNPKAFASRMQELALNPEKANEMGMAAAERAKAFSWDSFVRRLDDYVDTHC